MEIHEFFHKYANMPMAKRFQALDVAKHGLTNMSDIYKEIHDLEDEMRPSRIRQIELLRIAEKFL